MSHATAFYGTTRYKTKAKTTYKQRYQHTKKPYRQRIHGKWYLFKTVKQRYIQKVTTYRIKLIKGGQRLTVYGTPKQIRQVKEKITLEKWIPKKKYVDRVKAEIFLRKPQKYARHGKWITFDEKESP